MNKEIERKYSMKYIPNNMEISQVIDMEQCTIYRDSNTMIRIRRATNRRSQVTQYIYTVKIKCDMRNSDKSTIGQKYEIENYISKNEYEELLQRKISNIIQKTRINVPIENDLVIEIDIYHDYLEGLLTAEVEFPNEKTAQIFKKPDCLGEELGYKQLSNGKLAQMNKEQFRSKVTEEFLKNNRAIIKKLKVLI